MALSHGDLIRASAVGVMCEKYAELERKIVHLRRMVEQLTDPGTVNAARNMIREMEAEKAELQSQANMVDHHE
jgi:hypothetical protein